MAALGLAVSIGVIAGLLPHYVFGLAPTGSAWGLAAAIGLRETVIFIVLLFAMRRYLALSVQDVGIEWPHLSDVAIGVVLGAALIGIGLGIERLVPDKTMASIWRSLLAGGQASQVVATVVVGVWSPFVQEVIFRGALLRALRERLPPLIAVPVSALLFAGVHVATGWAGVIGAFVDGLAQGSITLRRRTLTAAITSHIVINLFGCLLVIYYAAHRFH